VPDGAVLVFLRCWVLLYGAVSMEVFGHLGFALDDRRVISPFHANCHKSARFVENYLDIAFKSRL
jgi:hypothetical protein